MAYECLEKSPVVKVGQTFVTKFGNIRLISVYDNGSGKIGVKPIGLPEEIRNTKDWQVESFYDGLITVKTNFFTLAGRGAHFWVCGLIEEPELNPLRITAITTYEVSDPDSVIADVLINGEGSGSLSISWGDQGTTTHAINGAGQYYFEKSLPVGSHNICGSIGDTQECATIIIEEEPITGELKVSKLELIQDVDSPGALIAQITMMGVGTGTLVIDWGDGTIERFEGYVAGLEKIGIEKPDLILHVCAWIEGSKSKECAYYIPMLYLLGIAGIGIIILMGIA